MPVASHGDNFDADVRKVTTGRAWLSTGPVEYRHRYLDMSNVEVLASNYTRAGHTCLPAMGFSFAAGTTDGAWTCTVGCSPACDRWPATQLWGSELCAPCTDPQG